MGEKGTHLCLRAGSVMNRVLMSVSPKAMTERSPTATPWPLSSGSLVTGGNKLASGVGSEARTDSFTPAVNRDRKGKNKSLRPSILVHTCDPAHWECEAGGSQV